jgi:hypothetical protein
MPKRAKGLNDGRKSQESQEEYQETYSLMGLPGDGPANGGRP